MGEAVRVFGLGYIRLYLTVPTPYTLEDTNFKLDELEQAVDSGLGDTVGKLAYRVLASRIAGGQLGTLRSGLARQSPRHPLQRTAATTIPLFIRVSSQLVRW